LTFGHRLFYSYIRESFHPMNFRQIVNDYFTFSRNERKGITILMVIIFLLAIANKTIFYFETPARIDVNRLNAELNLPPDHINKESKSERLFQFNPNTIKPLALDSLSLPEGIKKNIIKYREKGGRYYAADDFRKMFGMTDSIFTRIEPFLKFGNMNVKSNPVEVKKQLFNFDPNTANDPSLLLLGISEKQITIIRNYQKKGGKFKVPNDFLKLYGLSETQKKELLAYVVIEKRENIGFENPVDKQLVLIEMNGTDSVELKTLPGIGNVLSKRIIKYRDLLGGFYSSEQFKEIYGLNENTIGIINKWVTVDVSKIRKVDLNFSDEYELSRHPYIGKNLSARIIKFRTSYGNISNPMVLKDSVILTNKEYERLKPYL